MIINTIKRILEWIPILGLIYILIYSFILIIKYGNNYSYITKIKYKPISFIIGFNVLNGLYHGFMFTYIIHFLL